MSGKISLSQYNSTNAFYEVEVAPGLEQVAYQELRQQLGTQLRLLQPLEAQINSGVIAFAYRGDMRRLTQLNTVFNVYWVLRYDVARPKTLLAQQHFDSLLRNIRQVVRLLPQARYHNFGISAAGADSVVFQQMQERLAQALQMPFSPVDVDLLLRVRPARLHPGGWEVLLRLTPRPLSVRAWRVADMKGALNAAVAHCMALLTQPKPTDKFLNLTCGSGTLLIERLMAAPARRVIGCDIDAEALQYAQANLAASQLQGVVELHAWDARTTNLPDASMDAICADLPFGLAVGAHVDNIELYPALLSEAARVAKPRSRFVLMTQEVTLIETLLSQSSTWKVLDNIKVTLRGLHPRIYLLQRNA